MGGRTQAALYSEIDLDLSWSEHQLPQVERTKHVHGLHPYLGKFIPQLVDVFLCRYFRPGDCVYDPFVGSGTTLVEASAFGAGGIGCDISAFNCLLTGVKTAEYSVGVLEMALRATYEESRKIEPQIDLSHASEWLHRWYAPKALRELLAYRVAAIELDDPIREVAHVVLSRSARSARLTTHFDLDFPRQPATEPYYCHKHKRTCVPVGEAGKFLRRYSTDTSQRIRAFAGVRSRTESIVLHEDSRTVQLPKKPTGIITSPPYPGLIDYHEQHRYAYELLGLVDRRLDEIGPASKGTSRAALAEYQNSMVGVFLNASEQMEPGSPVVIVVNDSRNLYPEILERSGLQLEDVLTRHVNRRTGRRAGEFYENVLVCRVTQVDAATAEVVRGLLRTFMRSWLDDVPDPEEKELEGLVAPFHDALVPGIRLLNERSFSTRLGNLHERVASVIAAEVHAEVRQALDLAGTIPVLSREFITQRIAQLERRQASPDALYERDQNRAHFGNEVQAGTRIDLWIKTHAGAQHFFEIKSGKPNKGQCVEMKERLLTAFAIRRHENSSWWWGVPYSPYGSTPYRHNYALPFFDFDQEVKMGRQFWDFLGGDGTHGQLLAIYEQVGGEFAAEIEALRER